MSHSPAELLAQFSGLDVELTLNLPHRPSPLGSAVIISPDDSGSYHPSQSYTPEDVTPSDGTLSASPVSGRLVSVGA